MMANTTTIKVLTVSMLLLLQTVVCTGCPNVLVGAMTDRDRKDLLWSHNIYRQKLAYAEYTNQKQGANLNELQYSKILEDAAQNYINTECSQKVKGGTVTINGVTGEYGQLIYTYDGRIETNLDQTWTAYDCAKTEKYYVN